MPKNHGKSWKPFIEQLREDCKDFQNKEQMYEAASVLAEKYGRTETAVCNQIEKIKGWYWAAEK